MLFFTSRSRRNDRFLEWKVRIFAVAAVMMLVGISLEERWMTMGALVLLVAAMMLRFLPGGGATPAYEEDDESGEDSAE